VNARPAPRTSFLTRLAGYTTALDTIQTGEGAQHLSRRAMAMLPAPLMCLRSPATPRAASGWATG